jgi:hypothetical protein
MDTVDENEIIYEPQGLEYVHAHAMDASIPILLWIFKREKGMI